MWFLPPNGINDISTHLKLVMEQDDVLKLYRVMIVNSKVKLIDDIKNEISLQEELVKKHKQKGLIILVGNMLSLGITLDNCDVVMLLNNTISSDRIIQMCYRSMTESLDKNNKKTIGIVVDLNVNRILNTCLTFNIQKKNLKIDEKIQYIIENNLINIDADYFDNKDINSRKIINKLLDIWKADPANSLDSLLKQIRVDDNTVTIHSTDQSLLNKYFSSNCSKDKKPDKIRFKNDEDQIQEIKSGQKKIKDKDNNNTTSDNQEKEEDVIDTTSETNVSFLIDVLFYIIPLTCILTIDNIDSDLLNMLKKIKKDDKLCDIFHDQTNIWWSHKKVINTIIEFIEKYVDKNSNAYNISIQYKTQMVCLIDQPEKLLKIINDALKPKEIEKRKFGEVFTPMKLVNDMLNKLPNEVWNNKNLKWLDPATGMGNFPIAIYMRLMKSLKKQIPNGEKRKKHILENMLYMVEINKKNVFVTKKIFDKDNKYDLNIHRGDFLELDTQHVWNIDKFDIVCGNPPYQHSKEGNRTNAYGNTSLWEFFVTHIFNNSLKNEGYLVFVHPSGWRKPEHKLWPEFIKRQIIHLDIHSKKEGIKTFQASTRYDWYVLQNIQYSYKTIVRDELGVINTLDLRKWLFLPNYLFDEIKKLLTKTDGIDVIYSSSIYDPRKTYVSESKNNAFIYPVIHSMTNVGITYLYTNYKYNKQFSVPKVVLSFNETQYPYNDYKGQFGMSNIAFGIPIKNKQEGDDMVNAINSEEFRNIIRATKWGAFQTDWRMFKYFKKDFYKSFINEPAEKHKNNKDDEYIKVNPKKSKPTSIHRHVYDDDSFSIKLN